MSPDAPTPDYHKKMVLERRRREKEAWIRVQENRLHELGQATCDAAQRALAPFTKLVDDGAEGRELWGDPRVSRGFLIECRGPVREAAMILARLLGWDLEPEDKHSTLPPDGFVILRNDAP